MPEKASHFGKRDRPDYVPDVAQNPISPTLEQSPPSASMPSSPESSQQAAFTISRRPVARQVSIAVSSLRSLVEEYLLDCEYRQHRPHTVDNNRCFFRNFFWYLEHQNYQTCGGQEVKMFLHYLGQEPARGGRFGNPKLITRVRPITIRTYHRCLSTFFKWLVEEEVLPVNVMEKVKAPPVRNTLKEPLSETQIRALLQAAKSSPHRYRDTAILLFLLDTGCRAAELCDLQMKDTDIGNRSAKITGKGNKVRMAYWGTGTGRALLRYLRHESRDENDPLFVSSSGIRAGEKLTPSGLLQLMKRLGGQAGVKCGCHAWRRTFAVTTLNNGANLISVSRMLGHETLEITRGYLALSEASIETQHRQFSPVDRLRNL
jgi:site-specific recombinase XerD